VPGLPQSCLSGLGYFRAMKCVLFIILLVPSVFLSVAQDSVATKKRTGWWKTPYPASANEDGTFKLRNAEATFGRKMLRGSLLAHGMQGLGYAALAVLPSSISGWNDETFRHYGENMKRAFTSPPVFDRDHWYINYLGHPYQGAAFYNSVRSQNARIWQSSLFTLGHVLLWEYAIEAGVEQPSIQDLIVTPLAGIVVGEGIHQATLAMAKNGFRWYEVVAVVVLNPMFALNNGFRFASKGKGHLPVTDR